MRAKKALLAIAAAIASITIGAQNESRLKELIITNITPELSVYPCGDRHEAQVILRCQEPFDLVLASNYDANLDLTITTEGPEKVYSIVFKTKEEGTSFKGRQLTVVAEGFKKQYIPLNLNDKEKLEFLVSDPYSKLRSLFYTATEEGLSLIIDGMYDAAIDKFNIAKQCPEYPDVENHLDEYIAKCEKLKEQMLEAARYTDKEDYFNARAVYLDMLKDNPNCDIIRILYNDVNDTYSRVSRHDMEVAQAYYDTKRYEEARELYEHAIAQNNPQSNLAGVNLAAINLKRYKKDNHTRSMSYIYDEQAPIGFMTATLKPDKTGGYFTMSFSKGVIDMLSQKTEPVTTEGYVPVEPMYQASIGAGWTMRLYARNKNEFVPKVWLLMTPFSYATGGYYSKIADPNREGEFEEKYHLIHTLAPEAGIAVRIWRVVFSYRYQYRYLLNVEKPVSDQMEKARNLFGVGICW